MIDSRQSLTPIENECQFRGVGRLFPMNRLLIQGFVGAFFISMACARLMRAWP
jgi:hypothetical protein